MSVEEKKESRRHAREFHHHRLAKRSVQTATGVMNHPLI